MVDNFKYSNNPSSDFSDNQNYISAQQYYKFDNNYNNNENNINNYLNINEVEAENSGEVEIPKENIKSSEDNINKEELLEPPVCTKYTPPVLSIILIITSIVDLLLQLIFEFFALGCTIDDIITILISAMYLICFYKNINFRKCWLTVIVIIYAFFGVVLRCIDINAVGESFLYLIPTVSIRFFGMGVLGSSAHPITKDDFVDSY